jgi:hypothetical protein
MYEVINTFERADSKTKFFREASKANLALNDAYAAAEAAADGYRGRDDDASQDGNKWTVTIFWRDQPARDRFALEASLLFADFLLQRALYHAENRIRHSVFFQSVPDTAPPAAAEPVLAAPKKPARKAKKAAKKTVAKAKAVTAKKAKTKKKK